MIDTTPSLVLLILVAVLVGTGVTLILERSLSRIVIGSALITYGVNLLILVAGGRAGGPPILGQTEVEQMSDPLPQAMVLTAIVLGLALSAFMLAMSYRTWQLNANDEVQDDREDRRIALAASQNADTRTTDDDGESISDSAQEVRDETSDDDGDAEDLSGLITAITKTEEAATTTSAISKTSGSSGVIEETSGIPAVSKPDDVSVIPAVSKPEDGRVNPR